MNVPRLFYICHLLVQIWCGSKVGRKRHASHLVKTHTGKTYLLHTVKGEKKSPKQGENSTKKDKHARRGSEVRGHDYEKVSITYTIRRIKFIYLNGHCLDRFKSCMEVLYSIVLDFQKVAIYRRELCNILCFYIKCFLSFYFRLI